MDDSHDLELLLRSHVPLIAVESAEERRVVEVFRRLAFPMALPLFAWTVTEGLRRLDLDLPPQRTTAKPSEALGHIKATTQHGIYLLLDFHPYLDDPYHIRLLKEIAQGYDQTPRTVVLISHSLTLPPELHRLAARFSLALPNANALERIVQEEADRWRNANGGRRVKTDRKSLDMLVSNLSGLTAGDARRLARIAIHDDGAITESDLPQLMSAKYRLLDSGGILSFEFDTARFSEVAGLSALKRWLDQRRDAFLTPSPRFETPKGVLLVGVQGGGKSMAAKAVAGSWGLPLLRLDFGTLYNKFFGETERNLRESLQTAEVMSPCVLWIDEIEKGIATEDHDGGTSRRVLGTLLTWMAERNNRVFIVATANDIERLPPELIRKGRLDEIFFVDLPDEATRAEIFAIHLSKRGLNRDAYDLVRLAQACEGFSGAEIEQAVVSGLYLAREQEETLNTGHLLSEIARTRPLSQVMAEKMAYLRRWAAERTVPAH